ncbi:MAG: hypothetical protein MUD12_16610 [Spirochaetes bacterium]|jgi:hypothetical protein|nr:hypothetical protein [Spirochaetota bacterium]
MNYNNLKSYIEKARRMKDGLKREELKKAESFSKKDKVNAYAQKPYGFAVYWAMNSVRKTSSTREAAVYALIGAPTGPVSFSLHGGMAGHPFPLPRQDRDRGNRASVPPVFIEAENILRFHLSLFHQLGQETAVRAGRMGDAGVLG